MIALLQRVNYVKLRIDSRMKSSIGRGMLAFMGVQKGDTEIHVEKMVAKILAFRMFEDDHGKMNLNITQSERELLVVPQFTLAATTKKGNRPGFESAAEPLQAEMLFYLLIRELEAKFKKGVRTGVFGADMSIESENDGPVNFLLNF